MILDFKANKFFIVLSVLIAFGLATYLRFNDASWLFIGGLLAVFGLLTYYQLKRNTFRFVQNYEILLMIRLQAPAYLEAYQGLVEKGTRFNPVWTITKKQRLAMGYLFTGRFAAARSTLLSIENEFEAFLEADTYSFYLNQVIHFLLALLQGDDVKKVIKNEKKAFDILPLKAQSRLKDNINGYHQLVQLVEKYEKNQNLKEVLIEGYQERSDFMKIILVKAYPDVLKDQDIPDHQLFN